MMTTMMTIRVMMMWNMKLSWKMILWWKAWRRWSALKISSAQEREVCRAIDVFNHQVPASTFYPFSDQKKATYKIIKDIQHSRHLCPFQFFPQKSWWKKSQGRHRWAQWGMVLEPKKSNAVPVIQRTHLAFLWLASILTPLLQCLLIINKVFSELVFNINVVLYY